MARELKFRAWVTLEFFDKEGNPLRRGSYQPVNNMHYNNEDSMIFTVTRIDEPTGEYPYTNNGMTGLLEQYTGVKDTNNKEVYEGDIIRMHVIVSAPDDKIGVVKYSQKYGYSIHFTSGRIACQEYWAANDKRTIEVIGNIHENPELLEEK